MLRKKLVVLVDDACRDENNQETATSEEERSSIEIVERLTVLHERRNLQCYCPFQAATETQRSVLYAFPHGLSSVKLTDRSVKLEKQGGSC
jgi:hypothetical protein